MEKNWNNTTIEVIGVLKTDESGKIVFKKNQYEKYTATLKVYDDTPWSTLQRKPTWVFVDGLRSQDVEALKKLEAQGDINGTTRLVITGHLVKSPGKPGMNDLLNLKTLGIRPAAESEKLVVDFNEALTKDEWQVIRKERFGGVASQTAAPSAPIAPAAPV